MELKYLEIQSDIAEIKDNIKTIMDCLIPKINPKAGIVYKIEVMEQEIVQLKIDFLKRSQNTRIAAVIWAIISSSLVVSIIGIVIGIILRSNHI